MTTQRTRDILQRAREFHTQLSRFYERMGATAGREKIRMLLTYMSRHETNLAECLARYEREAAERVLDTWFKYVSEKATCKCFEGVVIPPEATVEEVVRIALWLDRCLVDLYTETAERAVSQEVRDLFTSLLKTEQKEENQMVRNALTLDQEM
jgi:rubrerythrin